MCEIGAGAHRQPVAVAGGGRAADRRGAGQAEIVAHHRLVGGESTGRDDDATAGLDPALLSGGAGDHPGDRPRPARRDDQLADLDLEADLADHRGRLLVEEAPSSSIPQVSPTWVTPS